MSALPPKADIGTGPRITFDAQFGDVRRCRKNRRSDERNTEPYRYAARPAFRTKMRHLAFAVWCSSNFPARSLAAHGPLATTR